MPNKLYGLDLLNKNQSVV